MNAERLHAIVKSLRAEVEDTGYPGQLVELFEGLTTLSDAPGQAEAQQRVSAAREALNEVLQSASSNDFSPVWRQALEEMGISDLVGEPLLEQIEAVLQVNDITPSTAAGEVGQIKDRVESLVTSLNQAEDAFNFLQISSEDLSPGEFEIGVMIPRKAVDNGLKGLGEEFVDLKKIIDAFSELAGENRPEVKVRSISSSEFQVFLDSAPAVAAMLATTLERLMKAYERYLNIRKLHRELSEAGIPEENLEGVSGFVSGTMEEKIREIVEEVLKESEITDEGRLNELRKDLTVRVNALAERIDNGYDVAVRAGDLPESVEGEAEELDPNTKKATETVLEAQKSLEFMNVEGKAILSLKRPDEPTGTTDS
jgi:hypothetical protein